MNYAWIENGVVMNVIWLYEGNAAEFPNAVPLGDRPVTIGDVYADGAFIRNGDSVLSPLETAEAAVRALRGDLVSLSERLRALPAVYTLLPEGIRSIVSTYAGAAE